MMKATMLLLLPLALSDARLLQQDKNEREKGNAWSWITNNVSVFRTSNTQTTPVVTGQRQSTSWTNWGRSTGTTVSANYRQPTIQWGSSSGSQASTWTGSTVNFNYRSSPTQSTNTYRAPTTWTTWFSGGSPTSNTYRPTLDNPGTIRAAPGTTCGSAMEAATVAATNVERRNRGLTPLECNAAGNRVARDYSRFMCQDNCFSHSCDGSAGDRLRRGGIVWMSYAENIAVGHRDSNAVMTGWMNSPGHKQNILRIGVTKIGVGVYACPRDGRNYWTMVVFD